MKDFLETNIPAIITAILGFGAWVYERRKKIAEVEQVETDVFKSMQGAYNTYVADANIQYKEVMKRISELQVETGKLQGEIFKLQEEVNHWKNKYNSLKKELDKNKK